MNILSSLFGRRPEPPAPKTGKSEIEARIRPSCDCLEPAHVPHDWTELKLHSEVQDTGCDAWKWLETLIIEARAKEQEVFAPRAEMSDEKWRQIVTLPESIGTLKSVKSLMLHGSHLVRIPREIGEMTNLIEFEPYTSYRLHWFPFEITRCKNLRRSTVSTRALYGNYRFRPPFPALSADPGPAAQDPVVGGASVNVKSIGTFTRCSVCDRMCPDSSLHRVWISLRVATDVLPLLVNACSNECIRRLPSPARGYVERPHKGGLSLKQPPAQSAPSF